MFGAFCAYMEIKELISRIERAKNHDAAWAEDMLDACKIAFGTDREFASNRLFALDREIDNCISENVGRDNAAAGKFFEIKKELCKFLAPTISNIFCSMSNGIVSRKRNSILLAERY